GNLYILESGQLAVERDGVRIATVATPGALMPTDQLTPALADDAANRAPAAIAPAAANLKKVERLRLIVKLLLGGRLAPMSLLNGRRVNAVHDAV
ncbi:MAG: hypothetical protein KKC79_04035, partial [Gammaproteobacteria bacterium]|nr:hypothetical protein [Gammaproteobacteria bacterium]